MFRVMQGLLIAICALSFAAGVKVEKMELDSGMPFVRMRSQSKSEQVNIICTYKLDAEDTDIKVFWTKDGKHLKDGPALRGKSQSNFELVNIERSDEGVYQCKVSSSKNSDSKDFDLVVYEKKLDAASNMLDIDYRHFACKVVFQVKLSATYPAIVAFCGIQTESSQTSNKREWVQKPFVHQKAGEPKLGFSSNDSDWTVTKEEGDYYALSLNATIDVRDLPHKGLLFANCEWHVADKQGKNVQFLMDYDAKMLGDGVVGMQNNCPSKPFFKAEDNDKLAVKYGDHMDDCRGTWSSDDNILSSLTCKRTGAKVQIGCYEALWMRKLNESNKREVYTQEQLQEFTKTCGEGRLIPILGLIIAAVLFNFTSK